MRFLSILSVFFSALLAFSVEPLIAKRLLPAFGGSAAVWVTCLVTFQGLLLLGYLYADLLLRLPRRVQLPVHAAVLLLPFLVMPFGPPHPPPPDAAPMGRLVLELLRGVALPFFALSTNSTLVQHWYAKRAGAEPWFLYATSNAGSLAGLLGYPLLVEPWIGLSAQSFRWMIGYVAFALVTATVAVTAASATTAGPPVSPAPSRSQIARWVTRSAIGAMLLTSISFWITLDVAALPLLWVAPLALYLLSFVLAFSPRVPFPRRILAILCMLFVILGLESVIAGAKEAALLLFSALGALFLGTWLVHGDLARDRPSGDRLSAYYLWIALGGFLGGVAGNVIAPQVFDTIAEFPLALAVLAFALAAERDLGEIRATLSRPFAWALAAVMLALLVITAVGFRTTWAYSVALFPVFVLLAGVVLFRKPGLFGVGATLTAVFLSMGWLRTSGVLEADRSFYGTLRVHEKEGVRYLEHGTTLHGVERTSGDGPPGSYYHPDGPLGSVVASLPEDAHVGVVGLGAGSLAQLSKAGQRFDYFEIDPAVERVARRWFRYLSRSAAPVSVEIGDARLTLQERGDATFDAIIVDAFSSDAVPVHLLTQEALAMYLRKLEPGGVVVFHVSNRYFDLRRVVKGGAEALGAGALFQAFSPKGDVRTKDLALDTWAVLVTRDAAGLESWRARSWTSLDAVVPLEWTDDQSSLVPLLWRTKKAPAVSPEPSPVAVEPR